MNSLTRFAAISAIACVVAACGAPPQSPVTDQNEAFAMADEIAVMAGGRIQQLDTPYNLYHRPATRFVADFIGQGVFVKGTMIDGSRLRIALGDVASPEPIRGALAGGEFDVLLRPDDVVHDDASPLRATVLHKAFRGAEILYTLQISSGERVLSMVPSHHNHVLGEPIGIRLDLDHLIVFPREGAAAAQPSLAGR